MIAPRWLSLGLFLVLAFAAAGIGAAATSTSVATWYASLHQPSWSPPNGIFAPVWTALYIAMAVAAWRAWQLGPPTAGRRTVSLYSAQLTLNALWSILFFGLRRPGAAFIDVCVLWALLLVMLVRFWRTDRLAGLIWLPYLAWVSFAAALNLAVWSLNR
jgi:tryptophan-rich sensory protein